MEGIELRTSSRTVHGKKVKRLRAQDWIPGVLYSPDIEPTSIQIQERDLSNALQVAGSTSLINLFVDDESKPHMVLAREIQREPLTGRFFHVDFYQVRLTEKVKTTPRLEFVGESPVVKEGDAVMIHGMNEVEVECLPTDLIDSIPVDVSSLKSLEDNILVSDLPVPPGVTILADLDDVVVSVVSTRMALMPEEEEIAIEEAEAEIETEEEAEAEAEA